MVLDMEEVWAALLLAVSGAVVTYVAVQRTQRLADESERRRMRRDVLRKLVGTRHLIVPEAEASGEFLAVLNEVVVAFSDDPEVMKALRQFDTLVARGFEPEDFNLLVQAMAEAAEMGHLDEDLMLRPYTTGPGPRKL